MNIAAVGVLAVAMLAAEQEPEKATADKAGAKAGQLVRFEVLIVDLKEAVEAPSAAKVLELERTGKLQARVRFQLASVEDVPAMIQFSEIVPRVSQRANPAVRGRAGAQFSDVNVGTTVRVSARVVEKNTIVAQFLLMRNALVAEAEQPADANAAVAPAAIDQMQSNATLRLMAGEPQVISGQQTGAAKESNRTWIVVTARIGAEPAPLADGAK